MSVGIECPVCEAVFLVKQASAKNRVRCPECKRKFRYSEEILAKKKPALTKKKPAKKSSRKGETSDKPPSKSAADNTETAATHASADKHERSQKKSKWKTTATEAPRLQTPKPVHDSSAKQSDSATGDAPGHRSGELNLGTDESENESSFIATIHARKKRKARRQTIYASITITVLSIATAILGFLLYRQLNLPADSLAGQTVPTETEKRGSNRRCPTEPFAIGSRATRSNR